MKCFLPFFLMLLPLFLPAETGKLHLNNPDTLKVQTTGINNLVLTDTFSQSIDSLHYTIKGEIIQMGENNRVEINKGRKNTNDNRQITNSKRDNPNDKKPITNTKNQITVKQTGKNNSAIINTP